MHLFAYNGKSSQEFMVNISGGDTWRKPAPIMETITVPGRNGQILNFGSLSRYSTSAYSVAPTIFMFALRTCPLLFLQKMSG